MNCFRSMDTAEAPVPDVVPMEVVSDDKREELDKMTIQDKVNWLVANNQSELTMEPFRLDPEKHFGHSVTVNVNMCIRDGSFALPLFGLSQEERTNFLTSVVFTLSRLVTKKNYSWSKERKQFSDYAELMTKLREDRIDMMYTFNGIVFSMPSYVRSLDELDQVWRRYCSRELEKLWQEHFRHIYLPLGSLTIEVRIYDNDDCKKKFQYAGDRILELMYPPAKRRY